MARERSRAGIACVRERQLGRALRVRVPARHPFDVGERRPRGGQALFVTEPLEHREGLLELGLETLCRSPGREVHEHVSFGPSDAGEPRER